MYTETSSTLSVKTKTTSALKNLAATSIVEKYDDVYFSFINGPVSGFFSNFIFTEKTLQEKVDFLKTQLSDKEKVLPTDLLNYMCELLDERYVLHRLHYIFKTLVGENFTSIEGFSYKNFKNCTFDFEDLLSFLEHQKDTIHQSENLLHNVGNYANIIMSSLIWLFLKKGSSSALKKLADNPDIFNYPPEWVDEEVKKYNDYPRALIEIYSERRNSMYIGSGFDLDEITTLLIENIREQHTKILNASDRVDIFEKFFSKVSVLKKILLNFIIDAKEAGSQGELQGAIALIEKFDKDLITKDEVELFYFFYINSDADNYVLKKGETSIRDKLHQTAKEYFESEFKKFTKENDEPEDTKHAEPTPNISFIEESIKNTISSNSETNPSTQTTTPFLENVTDDSKKRGHEDDNDNTNKKQRGSSPELN